MESASSETTKKRRNGRKVPNDKPQGHGCNDEACKTSKKQKGILRQIFTAHRLHFIVPYIFFSEVIFLGGFGIPFILPVIYENSAIYHQILGAIMIGEIVMNWYFIGYTDSSFNASSFSRDSLTFEEKPKEVPDVVKNSKGKQKLEDKHLEYDIYPYWSWSPCYKCKCWRPPRCHHCALCDKCIMKRDHHCFFTRNCVGFLNQKYFVVFCTWTLFSMIYALINVFIYYHMVFWNHVTVFDILPFFSFSRYLVGRDLGLSGIVVLMIWILVAFIWISFMQLGSALDMLTGGMITYERENRIVINDRRMLSAQLRGVFGDLWYLNFIIPLSGGRFAPSDDPYHWKDLEAPKRQVHVRVWKPDHLYGCI